MVDLDQEVRNKRVHALIDKLCGVPDEAANRVVDVMHAQMAALSWVHNVTGAYPAPDSVTDYVDGVAARLRTGEDDRDPVDVLAEAAQVALRAHRGGSP